MGKILVIGSLNMDFVIGVDEMPRVGETIFGKSLQLIPGGKGANQAFAAGKLGADVYMIGAVGDDDNGDLLIENLKSVGVNTSGISRIKSQNTGAAFISVNKKGDNCITVISGANMDVSPDLIDKNMRLFDECDIVLLQLEIPMETIAYVTEIAKIKGKTVILDPAPAPAFLPNEVLKNVDFIKPNESELENLTGVRIVDSANSEEILKASNLLINRGAKAVIVTLGKQGSVLVTEDITIHSSAVDSGKVVDTTAAGDCFTAAFASSLLESGSYETALTYANAASSIAVTRKGAQSSMPTGEEVKNVLSHLK